ncbi:MAG: redoxin family protein [Candidatus Eremiobacteraeota bacterium]|nr:redoxin family protein [Candidatus Eremiobacteraeota bacterium]
MITRSKLFRAFAAVAAALILAVAPPGARQPASAAGLSAGDPMLSLDGAIGWLNSRPLTPVALRGKIVLVDFWEYTCVNCLKTLPYERAWYERYARYGFTIVGIHTPEFRFSGDRANVAAAVRRLGITWPVGLDSDYAIWRRWNNDSWPHEFLFDESGRLVADHVGEGDYPDMEARIAGLVHAHHPHAALPKPMAYLPADDYSKPGAVCYPSTAETYVADWRGDGALGNKRGYDLGQVTNYEDAGSDHQDGRVYLRGSWRDAGQAMVHAVDDPAGRDYIDLRYHAIEVVSVLKPEDGKPVLAYVDQDGMPLSRSDAGRDVRYDPAGRAYVLVDAPREYDLVKNRHFGHHDLRLRPAGAGLGVYTFAFESCQLGADR